MIPRLKFEVQTAPTQCAFAAAGLGVAITDPFTARLFLPMGLRAIKFDPVMPFEFGVLLPITGSPHPLTEEFMELVVDSLDALP